jgi:hypothetical protein
MAAGAMVTQAALAAGNGAGRAGADALGIFWAVVIASWILLFAVMLGLAVVVYGARGRSRRRAAAAGPPPPRLTASPPGLAALMRSDAHFDEQLLLDAALTATLLVFAATTTGDEGPLRRLVTDRFWQTPFGQITSTVARDRRRDSRQAAADAARGSVSKRWIIPLDYHPSVPEIVAVDLNGMQRVSVRVAFGQLQAMVRPGAVDYAAGAAAPNFASAVTSIARSVAVDVGDGQTQAVSWVASGGHYDLKFVRPANARTDPRAALSDRTCTTCGATYRSELAIACAHCGAARAMPWGEWRLAEAVPVR